MTIKFPKSNIEISGKLEIRTVKQYDGGEYGLEIEVDLTPLKQSKSGVYCLRNKLNGRLYIGMTRNLETRKWRHINDLKKGIHSSKSLQFDYNEIRGFSEFDDEFEFEVIIYCYPSQLTFWEGILIDNLNPYYNPKKKKELTYDDIIMAEKFYDNGELEEI